jgi:branched-chain amino acid transport system ATP-binding protein
VNDGPLRLEVRDVSAGYGDTRILDDVSLQVPARTVVGLLGRNGTGKSTLLRVISGMLHPQSGSVLLNGEEITGLYPYERARRGMCCIAEGRSVFPSLTVRENLMMWSLSGKEHEAIERATDAFPVLGKRLKQRAGSLSGGEQQMLAVARAYVQQAQLVLIDEVSLGLAPRVIEEFTEFLVQLAQSGATLVLVEQYVNRALQLADYVYVLGRGTVAFHGASSSISEEELADVYLGIPSRQ